MNNKEAIASQVAKALQDGRIAFLVGTGISADRQSWIPLWADLILSLLEAIAGEEGKDEVQYVKPHMGLLFNEVILYQMVQVIGLDSTAEGIKICMDTNSYSGTHKFLAWAMKEFRNIVLTTNYDELIEEAGGWRHHSNLGTPMAEQSRDLLLKLHGTLSDLKYARFTINQIFAPLEANLRQKAVGMLEERIVVVAGYRGADEFDVIPLLFEEASPRQIVWLARSEIDLTIRKRLDAKHHEYFKADVDKFFQKVYKEANQGRSEPELDIWQPQCPSNQEDWWKAKLEGWGNNLWRHSKNEVRLLWARILDYLRVYQVYEDHETKREPAKEAYERFLCGSSDISLNLEARARLAYIKRTTGIGSPEEFYEVVDNIKTTLGEKRDKSDREKLQRLLGWALHQYGVTLQNAGDYIRARLVLDESAKLRSLIGDPELAYTLFQEFMNATRATRDVGGHVDDFVPAGWRSWLIKELEKCSNQFREISQPDHYGQTLHNIGFVHQFLADELEKSKNFSKAEEEYGHALETYREAMRVRERLRDLRMMAQSKVRIAQCNLGLARLARKRGDEEVANGLISETKKLAGEVKESYKLVPQEQFRWGDVEQICKQVSFLTGELKKNCWRE